MSNQVYANGEAIACKAGDDKVLAAMPDVCLSPPSPPAGPVPLPYPNTSFSKDMQEGSKTVQINGKEVMLKDQSYYKTSPLGDEAATNSFGGSVITHVITGKTYFNAWSMDVKFEDANVDRHMDLTTSNHASYPGSTGPMMALEEQAIARMKEGKCPCCNKALHPGDPTKTPKVKARKWYKTDKRMNRDEWHETNIKRRYPNPASQATRLTEYRQLIADSKTRAGCVCTGTPKPKLLPEPPCDVFFDNAVEQKRKSRAKHIKDAWDNKRNNTRYQNRKGILSVRNTIKKLTASFTPPRPPTPLELRNARQVNHLTPKSAGGCPTGNGNLQPMKDLCGPCQTLEGKFELYQ